jgi:hypothetical protein
MHGLERGTKRKYFRIKSWGSLSGSAALVFVAAALAGTSPPPIDESMSASKASWRAITKPTEGLTLGTLKIQYGQTTLPELLRAIKSGSIQHQGDAGESVYWLCYTVLKDSYNARIWIEAPGEMGGSEHAVTDVAVQRVTRNRPLPDCPVLPEQYEPLSFNNGVWLGASKATVEKAFPAGLLHSGELAFIGYQGKTADDGHCDGGYDLLSSLYLTFEAGFVVAMNAGQITSC